MAVVGGAAGAGRAAGARAAGRVVLGGGGLCAVRERKRCVRKKRIR